MAIQRNSENGLIKRKRNQIDAAQNFTRPARVELNLFDAVEILIKMTKVSVEPTLMGQFAPNEVENAAKILLTGLIEGIGLKLKEEAFLEHFSNMFILETDLYKLTDVHKLQEQVIEKEMSRLILPPHQTKQ